MDHSKILFLDIDDTLLTRDKQITPEVASAIDRALKAGHRIVIATGRTLPAVMPLLERLHLDRPGCFCITANGGMIIDCSDYRTIYENTVSREDAVYLMQRAEEIGLYTQIYENGDVVTKEDSEELQFYVRRLHIGCRLDPGLPETLDHPTIKVLAISLHDREKIEDYRRRMTEWADGRLSFFFSNPWYLEIVREGTSKGAAVRFLAEYLGIPIENTVSAGDMENDIPMIEAAHIGCAMANAVPEVKAIADYVTENDCDHSGVAEIIERFILS